MFENITVVIFIAIAVVAMFFGWWLENGSTSKKVQDERKGKVTPEKANEESKGAANMDEEKKSTDQTNQGNRKEGKGERKKSEGGKAGKGKR